MTCKKLQEGGEETASLRSVEIEALPAFCSEYLRVWIFEGAHKLGEINPYNRRDKHTPWTGPERPLAQRALVGGHGAWAAGHASRSDIAKTPHLIHNRCTITGLFPKGGDGDRVPYTRRMRNLLSKEYRIEKKIRVAEHR